MSPAPGQDEPLKRMAKILNHLWNKPDSLPFREPVDWRGLELYDYPDIIDKMMDLGTIKRRLERNQYSTAHQCAEDIRLVWDNCMTYNADGSDFWLLAKSYSRRFEDRYRKVMAEFDVGEDFEPDGAKDTSASSFFKPRSKSPKPSGGADESSTGRPDSPTMSSLAGTPSLDARANFAANIFLLSGVELGHVMTKLDLECPKALEAWGEAKMEINVDAIPADVFANVNSYVQTKVGNRSLMDESEYVEIPKKKKRKSN